MAAPALPPAVASGELITSAWGNGVVNSLKLHAETRPYFRATSPGAAVAHNVNSVLGYGGYTDLVDPGGMLQPAAMRIPTKWPGLWTVDVVIKFGAHPGVAEMAGWIAGADGFRYGVVQIVADAAKPQWIGTSAVIVANAGDDVVVGAFQLNGSALSIGFQISATWLGTSPV